MLALAMLFFDADAVFPMTKKYKALAKEYEEKEERKKAKKAAQKAGVELDESAEENAEERVSEIAVEETESIETAEETDGENHG